MHSLNQNLRCASGCFAGAALNALSSHIAILDETGSIIAVNHAWRRFAEANHPQPSTVCEGADYLKVCDTAVGIDADQAAKFAAAVRAIMRCEQDEFSLEYPCHSPDEKRWFNVHVTRITNEDAVRVVVAHETITARIKAEEELLSSEVHYRTLFEEAGDGILLRDRQGNFLKANQRFLEMLGCTLDELQKLKHEDFIHSEDLENFPAEEVSRRCENGETFTMERRYRRKDGSYIPVQLTVRMVDPVNGIIQGLVRDVTDRKRAEDNLKKQTEILQKVFDNLPAMINFIGADGSLILVNREWERALGWSLEEVQQQGFDVFSECYPDLQYRQKALKFIADSSGEWVDFRTRTKNGREIDTSWAAVRLSDGTTIGIGQDVTARKRTDAALKAEHRKTQRMEAELRLAQKLEAVGQLASGIAHEINTPMQYIGDSVQFLRTAFDDLLKIFSKCQACIDALSASGGHEDLVHDVRAAQEDADIAYLSMQTPRAFDRTVEGIERVSSIVRSLREFAHPDQKEKAPADINRALQNVLTVCRNEYKYLAEVVTAFDELPTVMCHLGEISQVFLNLIINAAHAIESVIKGTDKKGIIGVRTLFNYESVQVTIEDTGCGIPEEIQPRIFDPFFTTKPVGKGTGQGLAISRSIIVDKHGGKLTFDSVVGRGTAFYVELPVGAKV
ncbi:MAG: PAS domain S-box protein [Deltaproteobacteria bacterium]|nr:PAS domain S-box protein [Deltaproteobacteria bacterium]